MCSLTMINKLIHKPVGKDDLIKLIEAQGLETIRCEYPDFHGIARGKRMPAKEFVEIIERGVNFCVSVFSLDLSGNAASGTGLTDEVDFCDMTGIPDLDSFRILPWEENTAHCLLDLFLKGEPLRVAPRYILKTVVQNYNQIDIIPIVAVELEFYILEYKNGHWVPYSDTWMNYTANRLSDDYYVLKEIEKNLQNMGIDVVASHHEYYPGQYEINLKHGEALKSIDNTFAFKCMVKEIAHRRGLRATFAAKPLNKHGGSGSHVHVSLLRTSDGKSLFHDPNKEMGVSDEMRSFIGGVLKHVKAMMLIVSPTINSYKRVVPFYFSPIHALWGYDNRTLCVRIPHQRNEGTHIEVRCGSADANPYLATAAILAAGLDGLKNNIDPGEPFSGNSYKATNIDPSKFLPGTLSDALVEFERDTYFREILGHEFVQAYVAVKKMENERFRQYVTDWEFNEYTFYL